MGSFWLPLAAPPLPAPTLSPVKSARREQLVLLITSSLRRALLSKDLSLRLLSAHSWMMLLPVKPTLTCGSQTWPAASTTTLSLREMSAADMADEPTIAEAVICLQGDCFCGQDGHTDD